MTHLRRSNGFSVIEVIVAVVVVAIIGAGVYLYLNHSALFSSNPEEQASTSATLVDNSYEGWRTYTLASEGSSVRYPTDWKLANISADPGSGVTFSSPSGKVKVWYYSASPEFGGTCGEHSSPVKFEASEPFTVKGYSGKLRYVELKGECGDSNGPYAFGLVGGNYSSDSALSLFFIAFPTKNADKDGSNGIVRLYAEVSDSGMTADDFYASSEAQTAEKIIKSIAY